MRVNQDSRTIKPGEWFVAVKGENFDGHDFIKDALAKGASGVLELEKLFELAKKRLQEVKPRVVAVTGSYGKTTTKEAIYKVLSSKLKGARTKGNLNTPLGVAMEVVNGLKPRHEFFIAEVGMDRLGEIKQSCGIISPQIGVLTSVGEMHLEKLGTLENIKKAKAELLESLPGSGAAVLNWDDEDVREISGKFAGRKIKYGAFSGAGVGADKVDSLPILGERSKYAALAAYCVGKLFDLEDGEITSALAKFKPPKGRLNLITLSNGVKIIDDTYNAGPESTIAALEVLEGLSGTRKVVILGDMLELGFLEKASHVDVLKKALEVCDIVMPVGERMGRAARGIGGRRFNAFEEFRPAKGDAILVKGSRGMRMERFVRRVKSAYGSIV